VLSFPPFRAERQSVRELLAPGEFIEIFVDAPLEVCIARDAKGLWQPSVIAQFVKARLCNS
jgi:bifunctional enzyme CysN/CysC